MSDAPDLIEIIAGEDAAGARLDKWLSEEVEDLSRSRAKALIEQGVLTLNGAQLTDPRAKIVASGVYVLARPAPVAATPLPEDIPLDILFEDKDLIVLNKPVGLVVHPSPGAWSGTLVNALLHHCGDELSGIGGVARPGIVHRLDKETSGVMVVAKSEAAHVKLVDLFQAHDIERAYLALTRGAPRPLTGRIETRIARSTQDRKKMAVVREPQRKAGGNFDDPDADQYDAKGKLAITNYKTLKTYGVLDKGSGLPAAALVECRLETGRTHQIRVHMAHIGAPLVGDPTYGKFRGLKAWGSGPAFDTAVKTARAFKRQALHAAVLGFEHPVTGEALQFETDPPEDFVALLKAVEGI
ncbi:MAG: RluA family pseudouridine synthase [Pseudomonadota bacterium]